MRSPTPRARSSPSRRGGQRALRVGPAVHRSDQSTRGCVESLPRLWLPGNWSFLKVAESHWLSNEPPCLRSRIPDTGLRLWPRARSSSHGGSQEHTTALFLRAAVTPGRTGGKARALAGCLSREPGFLSFCPCQHAPITSLPTQRLGAL